jgi:CBS domain-containing protein
MDMVLSDMAELLARKGISGAPVIDSDGRVVGIISEKDLLRKMGVGPGGSFMQVIAYCLKHQGCAATPMKHQTVRDIMTTPAITAPQDISVAEISALFVARNINRLPIVDIDNRPVGIVTRGDLIHSYHLFQSTESL